MKQIAKAMEAYKSAQKVDFFHLVVINHRREVFERSLQGERIVSLTPEENRKIFENGWQVDLQEFLAKEYELELVQFVNGDGFIEASYALAW